MNKSEKETFFEAEIPIESDSSDTYVYTVSEKENGLRADVFISSKLDRTRSYIQKLADDGLISVNGVSKKKNHKLSTGDVISVSVPPLVEAEIKPENIPLNVVFEDEHLLVVDKPKGMVVHPAPGNYSGTLVNALMHHCGDSLSGINGCIRPGIVHRIDKDTSGLLIVAKNDIAHNGLAEQISVHSFTRIYEAIVVGNVKEDSFKIDLPIGRHPTDRKKMTVIYENSKSAITNVDVISRYKGYTHIRCRLETGRTHQIRVHMAHIGHPVLGDEVYGKQSKSFPKLHGQCLLAKYISFVHPITKETLSFTADMPEYFIKILSVLNNSYT